MKQKCYANRHFKATTNEIGDKVLELPKKEKQTYTKIYVVTKIKRRMIAADNPVNNHCVSRNISQFIKVLPDACSLRPMKKTSDEETDDGSSYKIDCSNSKTTLSLDNSNK